MPIIRDIIYGAVTRGANLNELCALLEISVSDLNDSNKKLDFKKAYAAWEVAVKTTKDSLLGLHLGESTNPSILGLVGHFMQSSPSLVAAFKSVCDYSETATNMFHYAIKEKGDYVVLQFKPAALWMNVSPLSARHATEQAMAGTLQVFYLLSGKRIYPRQTEFVFKRQNPLAEYERVFKAELVFNSSVNQLVFLRSQLEASVLSYDKSLYATFERMLIDKKKKKDLSITNTLRQLILLEFKGQVPSIDVLSAKLNLTPRSLQRKLLAESITFRSLTGQIKRDIASQLLAVDNLKVAEVAKVLGYSEASAFRRAFKTWNGKSPRQR